MEPTLILSAFNIFQFLLNLYLGITKLQANKKIEKLKKEHVKEIEIFKLQILNSFEIFRHLSENAAKIENLIGSMISVAEGNEALKEETLKKYYKCKEEFRLFKESNKPFFPDDVLNKIEDFYKETCYFCNRVNFGKTDQEWKSYIDMVEGKKQDLIQTYNDLMDTIRKNTITLQK